MSSLCDPGVPCSHNDEQNDYGPGIYAVSILPPMGTMLGIPSGNLILLTYKIPTRSNNSGAVNEIDRQAEQQQHGRQRQVIMRRFQFAVQINLVLILKLAAVVFLFHQEGSRRRLILLTFFASLVYLHQTGAFAPLLRWLRQAGTLPQPQAGARPENAPVGQEQANNQLPEEMAAEDQAHPAENGAPAENDNRAEAGRANGVDWFAKELKLIVIGIVTSLLPGFHHNND